MYVLVHHTIREPGQFWSTAEAAIPQIPEGLKLHHSLSAKDGSRASCLWEADSVEAVRSFLEPALGAFSSNEYAEAENREGIVLPTQIRAAAQATSG